MKGGFVFFYLTVLTGCLTLNPLMTEEEHENIKILLKPKIKECLEELVMEEDTSKEMSEYRNGDSCFMLCFFQKLDLMNKDGMFDYDIAVKQTESYIKDEDRRQKFVSALEVCRDVNKADVSEAKDAECERGNLLSDCIKSLHKKFETSE